MLRPEYLEGLPDEILELFSEAEQEILADMARRISTYDFWIPAADHQNRVLREAGIMQEDILTVLSATTRKSKEELRDLMQRAGSMALHNDESIYSAGGFHVPSIKDSLPLRNVLNAGYQATATEMQNLCRTTARTATKQFEDALDRAWLNVSSGAFDADAAIRSAVKELSEKGIQSITYPSGKTDSIETAVRRAVVTGVNQTAGQLQIELADELGCDLVEVTAHSDARPEHALWQGRIYSRSGKHPNYPPFVASTGYGTGEGLCGWNCRHSFGPYIEGSPPVYTQEDLDKLNEPTVEYDGKKMTEYEARQRMRYNERQIRRWKREEVALNAAGLDSSDAVAKVSAWQSRQRDFIDQTGFKRDYAREQVALAKSQKNGIIYPSRHMALGLRQPASRVLSDEEIRSILDDADALGIDHTILLFNTGTRTGFIDGLGKIGICGDILPDTLSKVARDRMSQRAVLAHEFYGHLQHHPSEYAIGDWRDEFRASYEAAKNAPNLTYEDRALLMIDAYDRAREAGELVEYDALAKEIIYGKYDN